MTRGKCLVKDRVRAKGAAGGFVGARCSLTIEEGPVGHRGGGAMRTAAGGAPRRGGGLRPADDDPPSDAARPGAAVVGGCRDVSGCVELRLKARLDGAAVSRNLAL